MRSGVAVAGGGRRRFETGLELTAWVDPQRQGRGPCPRRRSGPATLRLHPYLKRWPTNPGAPPVRDRAGASSAAAQFTATHGHGGHAARAAPFDPGRETCADRGAAAATSPACGRRRRRQRASRTARRLQREPECLAPVNAQYDPDNNVLQVNQTSRQRPTWSGAGLQPSVNGPSDSAGDRTIASPSQ